MRIRFGEAMYFGAHETRTEREPALEFPGLQEVCAGEVIRRSPFVIRHSSFIPWASARVSGAAPGFARARSALQRISPSAPPRSCSVRLAERSLQYLRCLQEVSVAQ